MPVAWHGATIIVGASDAPRCPGAASASAATAFAAAGVLLSAPVVDTVPSPRNDRERRPQAGLPGLHRRREHKPQPSCPRTLSSTVVTGTPRYNMVPNCLSPACTWGTEPPPPPPRVDMGIHAECKTIMRLGARAQTGAASHMHTTELLIGLIAHGSRQTTPHTAAERMCGGAQRVHAARRNCLPYIFARDIMTRQEICLVRRQSQRAMNRARRLSFGFACLHDPAGLSLRVWVCLFCACRWPRQRPRGPAASPSFPLPRVPCPPSQ